MYYSDNPEQDFQNHIANEDSPYFDEIQAEQDRIYDEQYLERCEETDKQIRLDNMSWLERFRQRAIDKLMKTIRAEKRELVLKANIILTSPYL